MITLAYVTPNPGGARHETREQPTTTDKERKTNITSTFNLGCVNIYIYCLDKYN